MMKRKLVLGALFFSLFLVVSACWLPTLIKPESTSTSKATLSPTASIISTSTEIISEGGQATPTPSLTPSDIQATSTLVNFPNPEIFIIRMFTHARGWAVADDLNHLLVTEDGGETWLDITPPGLLPLPSDVTSLGLRPFLLDEDNAWFTPSTTASDSLFYTSDGGKSWAIAMIPFDRASYFFLNTADGFALEDLGAGAGSHYVALHRTTDGGSTWVEIFSHEPGESKSLPESGTKNGITFLDQDRGFIGGSIPMTDHFHFYVTNDGGVTWTQEADISLPGAFSGSFLDVWQPIFVDENTGYLPVRASTANGGNPLLIYRSTDAGSTWTYQDSVLNGKDIDFIHVEKGWVAADTELFQSSNAGSSWESVPTAGIPDSDSLIKVDFVDNHHGWVLTLSDEGTSLARKVYRTTDGGDTWSLLNP